MTWERLPPILSEVQGVQACSAATKCNAVAALRAKSGRREIACLRKVDGHGPQ